jgi:hexosaminidase
MNTDWNSFANALATRELPRLKFLNKGFNYRVPPPGAIIENGFLKANSEYPGLKILYIDLAREPREFKEYTVQTSVNGNVILKCVDASGGSSRLIELKHH